MRRLLARRGYERAPPSPAETEQGTPFRGYEMGGIHGDPPGDGVGVQVEKRGPFHTSRRFLLLLLALIGAYTIITALTPQHGVVQRVRLEGRPPVQVVLIDSGHLHDARVNYCRAVLSTSVLDYRPPKWANSSQPRIRFAPAKDSDVPKAEEKLPLLPPLTTLRQAIMNYVSLYGAEENTDLLVAVGADDVMFQLPPSALAERYRAMKQRAEKRLRSKYGRLVDTNKIRQSIVFAARSTCKPPKPNDPCCYLQPEAPVSSSNGLGQADVPHYLDSSFVIGPVDEIYALLSRAATYWREHQSSLPDEVFGEVVGRKEHVEAVKVDRLRPGRIFRDPQSGDLEWMVNIIFAEQELHRSLLLAGKPSWYKQASHHVTKTFGMTQRDISSTPERDRLALLPDKDYEFGIALDYENELFVNALEHAHVFAKHNGERSPIVQAASGGRCGLVKKLQLGADMANVRRPLSWLDESDEVKATPWSQMPLYTDPCSGVAPIVISAANMSEVDRDGLWQSMWYQHRAGQLHAAQVQRASRAKAQRLTGSMLLKADRTAEDFDASIDVLRKEVNVGNATLRSRMSDALAWTDMCGGEEMQRKLFGDGPGAW